MDKLPIRGGRLLRGEVTISGAKNTALPGMCAALPTDAPLRPVNLPRLNDVRTMRQLLDHPGVRTQTHGARGGMSFHAAGPIMPEAPYALVKTMRASVLVPGQPPAPAWSLRPSSRTASCTSTNWRAWAPTSVSTAARR